MGEERRKNGSRKRTVAFDVVYQVRWNDERRTFDVFRDKDATGAFAQDKHTAIRLAIRAAQREESGLKVIVSSIQDDKPKAEWSR